MARLPTPGGDTGNWGKILNDFLLTAHHNDGSLKSSELISAGGLLQNNNLSDLDSPATARSNLGLASLLHGNGAPDNSAGNNNDFYIDNVANMLYGPKTGDTWPVGISIKGDKGDQGEQGPQGELPDESAMSGRLLALAKISGSDSVGITKNTLALEDFPGATAIVTTGVRPVLARWYMDCGTCSAANVGARFYITVDGTIKCQGSIVGTTLAQRVDISHPLSLSAGNHTISIQWQLTATGSATVYPAGFFSVPTNAWLMITEQ